MKAPIAANVIATVAFSAIIASNLSSIPSAISMPFFFKQYSIADDIPKSIIKNHGTISGKVVKVIDGDTIRIRHYPLHPFIESNSYSGPIYQNTISVRVYGVDAPELGKRGNSSMPLAEEARDWAKNLVDGKIVKVKLLRKDQYGRVVAKVSVRRTIPFLPRTDLSMELAKKGYATLYTGGGAEYDDSRKQLEANIDYAQKKKRGIWWNGSATVMSPAEYKRTMKAKAKAKAR